MELITICRISTVLLLASFAGVQCSSAAKVTNITATNVNATEGTTITITCTAVSSSTIQPLVHFIKSFSNYTWHLYINDGEEEIIEYLDNDNRQRFHAAAVLPTSNTLVVTYTIYNAKIADTGNYTCKATNSSLFVTVNVLAEATNISMYFNDELIPQIAPTANASTLPTKFVRLNERYRLNCTIGGGNPYPEVILVSAGGSVPGPAVYTRNWTRTPDFLARVTRNATVSVPYWTVDVSYIGKPLYCYGGISNPNALRAGFIPVSNHTEPMFHCNDTVYVGKYDANLEITCSVYSFPSSLTTLYIYWLTADHRMMNISTQRVIPAGTSQYSLDSDGHYKLIINAPRVATEHWWTMTLKIEAIRSLTTDNNGVKFDFVAVSPNATAKHVVTARVESQATGVATAVDVSLTGLSALLLAAFLTGRRQ